MKSIIILLMGFWAFVDNSHVKWNVSIAGTQKVGEVLEINFDAKIDPKWYVYSSVLQVDGPMPTACKLEESDAFEVLGTLTPIKAKEKFDTVWEGKINYFEKTAKLTQKIRVLRAGTVKGTLTGQACSNIDGMCMPFSVPFELKIGS